jgi:hypothetical protein
LQTFFEFVSPFEEVALAKGFSLSPCGVKPSKKKRREAACGGRLVMSDDPKAGVRVPSEMPRRCGPDDGVMAEMCVLRIQAVSSFQS